MSFHFSNVQYNDIRKMMIDGASLKNGANMKDGQYEFEVRFSTYVKPDITINVENHTKKPNNYRFVPVIEEAIFKRVLAQFENYVKSKDNSLQVDRTTTVDYAFEDRIRRTEYI